MVWIWKRSRGLTIEILVLSQLPGLSSDTMSQGQAFLFLQLGELTNLVFQILVTPPCQVHYKGLFASPNRDLCLALFFSG